jgi:hypothetical protein
MTDAWWTPLPDVTALDQRENRGIEKVRRYRL